jgi:hypothetical protein
VAEFRAAVLARLAVDPRPGWPQILRLGAFLDPDPAGRLPRGARRGPANACTYTVGEIAARGLPDGWSVGVGIWAFEQSGPAGSLHTWLICPSGAVVDPSPVPHPEPVYYGYALAPDRVAALLEPNTSPWGRGRRKDWVPTHELNIWQVHR